MANKYAYGIISEISFFALLYYAQYLLNVDGNLWVSSLFLWVLSNISIAFCPAMGKCHK